MLTSAVLLVASLWISGGEPSERAPILRREFTLDAMPQKAELTLAVAGWCEVYVNGSKVGRDVLSPVTCQPEKRISSLSFNVTTLLRMGTNEVEVLLGNGWFNTITKSSWGFPEAVWKSRPKCCGEFKVDGYTLFVTDGSWRAFDSPIVFTALRNGEWYDARLENSRSRERSVTVERYSPAGLVSPEDAVPCRVCETFEPVCVVDGSDGRRVFDFGANITGWCEIEVSGEPGSKVLIDYDESITTTNTPLGYISIYLREYGETRPVQHDEYTLAGRSGVEVWHPRFTYHGFRYAFVTIKGEAKLKSIRAHFVHSAFAKMGSLETSDKTFAALQAATERSYLSNFTGIPTDCPHREKNGWTGDAQLAMETGLWNFDGRQGYVHFLRMVLDAQRPNGAVPCILPCTHVFGFGWGSGPAWDAILFEIPWQLFRFYGDEKPAREAYGAMKKYLAFIETKADEDGLYDYGLGDWCAGDDVPTAPTRLTDSAYVYLFNRRAEFWARRFGDGGYAKERVAAAARIRVAFLEAFYKEDGLYGGGTPTELAAPLYFKGLAEHGTERRTAQRLAEVVRKSEHKAFFGILGAKWIPRVLADYGYADDAWKLFTQSEVPGWAHWLQFGDGTLRENWNDHGSHNHIMFGDISAWAYEYAAGIVPVEPGFRKIMLRPHYLTGVDSVRAVHKTPYGEISAGWKRVQGQPKFECSVPNGVEVVKEVQNGCFNRY